MTSKQTLDILDKIDTAAADAKAFRRRLTAAAVDRILETATRSVHGPVVDYDGTPIADPAVDCGCEYIEVEMERTHIQQIQPDDMISSLTKTKNITRMTSTVSYHKGNFKVVTFLIEVPMKECEAYEIHKDNATPTLYAHSSNPSVAQVQSIL